jgi:Tfp pilus assembly protein PilN
MVNINFVPDDYIQKKDSNRSNWMYLFLCLTMVGALAGTFGIIKMRQNAVNRQSQMIQQKLAKAQEDIVMFEQLQIKRKEMMQTALTAVGLLETAPRSVIVASLTNTLPEGTSLLKVEISEKVSNKALAIRGGTYAKASQNTPAATAASAKKGTTATATSKAAQSTIQQAAQKQVSTLIQIEGIAPSDKQVADFIANLDSCALFNEVDLVYTKEFKQDKSENRSIRTFKLTTSLKKDAAVTKGYIEDLRFKGV